MEWVETTGRTVDEAKQSALEQLGVAEPDAEFEVLAEPKIGLFGRLKEEARVRARVKPRYPRSKGERRDRRRTRAARPEQGSNVTAPDAVQAAAQADDNVGPARKTDEGAARAARPQPATRRRRRTGGMGSNMPTTDEGGAAGEQGALSSEEIAKAAEDFLEGLLRELGATAQISAHQASDDVLELAITGEGLGTLIGPKGSTLVALQELTRTVLQRRGPRSETRVVVDVNGYRKRRAEALARFARQVADDVLATHKKRALEPMPPADRKVVHDSLSGLEGIATVSEGEEPNRRVVIVPVGEAELDPSASGDLQNTTS